MGVNTQETSSHAEHGKRVYLFSATPHPDALHVNTLDFNFFTPIINFLDYDYLILTSKKAVDALQNYKKEDYINIPALCISKFTSEYYESFGGKILELGDGIGSSLQNIIDKYSKDKKWLYLRAKEIAGDTLQVDEAIVYESSCSEEILNFKLEDKKSILIFTSPSSVECFLRNNTLHVEQKIIVIGTTTAKSLPTNINYNISDKTSIGSCIEIANEFKKK